MFLTEQENRAQKIHTFIDVTVVTFNLVKMFWLMWYEKMHKFTCRVSGSTVHSKITKQNVNPFVWISCKHKTTVQHICFFLVNFKSPADATTQIYTAYTFQSENGVRVPIWIHTTIHLFHVLAAYFSVNTARENETYFDFDLSVCFFYTLLQCVQSIETITQTMLSQHSWHARFCVTAPKHSRNESSVLFSFLFSFVFPKKRWKINRNSGKLSYLKI